MEGLPMASDTVVGTASETAQFMQYFSYFATVIRDDGLRRVIITVFTVSWSVSIVSDAVFFDLGSKDHRRTSNGNTKTSLIECDP